VSVRLGTSEVHLRVTERGTAGLTFVNLHENEQTSVVAARALIADGAGRLVELRAQGRRLVSFRIGWRAHTVDPNRIFTEPGVLATLRALGPDSAPARAAARSLREAVLALLPLPDGRPVVALHNNAGTAYSIANYAPGQQRAADAAAVHVGRDAGPQEFFIVTDPWLFAPLAGDGFNVVLQAVGADDDGSLSLWAQGARRPYINVEAQHGRVVEQRRMLEAVVRHFGASAPGPGLREGSDDGWRRADA
jgi:hypothetical protein